MPYLTPDTAPGTTKCRVLIIPDDKEWLALVTGALSELTHAYNFEEFGTATPEETAQTFRDMLALYVDCEPTVTDLIIIEERQTQNTHGGTFNGAGWRTRALNTEVIDTGNIASLSGNQVTIPAGTYRVKAFGTSMRVGGNTLALYNVTDSVYSLIGSTGHSAVSTDGNNESFIDGQITIAATKTFELRHYCNTTVSTFGFGFAANITTEIYAQLVFEKLPE